MLLPRVRSSLTLTLNPHPHLSPLTLNRTLTLSLTLTHTLNPQPHPHPHPQPSPSPSPSTLTLTLTPNACSQLPAGTPTFTTEFAATTRKRDGAGDYVVSGKRRTFAEYERTSNGEAIEGLQMADAEEIVATVGTAEWTLDEIAKVAIAALAIAVAGLVLGTTGLIVASSKARVSKPRSAEMALPARELEVPVKVQSATADFA